MFASTNAQACGAKAPVEGGARDEISASVAERGLAVEGRAGQRRLHQLPGGGQVQHAVTQPGECVICGCRGAAVEEGQPQQAWLASRVAQCPLQVLQCLWQAPVRCVLRSLTVRLQHQSAVCKTLPQCSKYSSELCLRCCCSDCRASPASRAPMASQPLGAIALVPQQHQLALQGAQEGRQQAHGVCTCATQAASETAYQSGSLLGLATTCQVVLVVVILRNWLAWCVSREPQVPEVSNELFQAIYWAIGVGDFHLLSHNVRVPQHAVSIADCQVEIACSCGHGCRCLSVLSCRFAASF